MNRFEAAMAWCGLRVRPGSAASSPWQQQENASATVNAVTISKQNSCLIRTLGLLAIFFVTSANQICLFLVFASTSVAALESERTIAQFAHTAWGPKQGAPSLVQALAQSADGYLWLGTPDGLYRFDGVIFERYEPQSGGPFRARNIRSLLALPNGDLWIGFMSGISLLRNGNATNYTVHQGVPDGRIRGFAQDREGTIWAATTEGLARLDGNQWKTVAKEWNFPGKTAYSVFLDRQGTLWVSTEDTLVFLPLGAGRFQPTGIPVDEVSRIAQASSGKLWMAETTRSVRPVPLFDQRQPPDGTEVQVGSVAILFASDGALWIASLGDGLRRSPAPELLTKKVKQFGTEVESFTSKDGLSDDVVYSILQDREGNVWVGTNKGLDRFHKTNLVPIALPFKPGPSAVLAAGDGGDVWVANPRVAHVHGGHAEVVPVSNLSKFAYSDPAGVNWWSDVSSIHRYVARKYTPIPLPQALIVVGAMHESLPGFTKPQWGTMVAAEDGSGALWMAAQAEGLFYRNGGTWKRPDAPPELAKLVPYAAFTDWMGRVWFGYGGGTIVIVDHEKVEQVFRAEDSVVGNVRTIGGRGRHTWVGGDLGLALFDRSRFRRVMSADGETFGSVLGIEESSDGTLWLAESRGVIEISSRDVQEVLANSSYRVKYRIFDTSDGLPGAIQDTGYVSKEIQGTDGRIWFLASDGIAWLNPANISTNPLPPTVLIRSVKTNGRQLDSLANPVLPPRTTDLQISYTALSLSVPERVRFRYRLEGVDRDWQDAGTRREALYTRLDPGQYHFQVIACNNDGVWNDKGAHLDFEIAPAWYQTNWFRTAYVGVFLALLWGLYQLRLRQLRRQFNVRLEARLNERTRIAQDLHDTFLQGIQGLLLRFHTATSQLRKDEPARRIFEETLEQSDQVMLEGRELVFDLRATLAEPNDLPTAFADFGERMRTGNSCEFKVVVNGAIRPLHPVVFEELFKIGKEALGNAFRHSGAHTIEAELNYERSELRVQIRDDGTGIDSAILRQGHRDGHFGLPGMRERAQKIGAHMDLWSRARAGTEIELRIAARIAYVSETNGSRLSQLRRLWHGTKH